VRPKIAAAAGLLLFAAPGTATAGDVTPVQYAYGGGSNAAAVIASRPSASGNGQSAQSGGAGSSQGGAGAGARAGSSQAGAGGTAGSSSGPNGAGSSGGRGGGGSSGEPEQTAQPLVGLAGGTASPAGSFDAFHRAIPRDAVWAIGLAVACALGAWLIRRRSA
jgi:hypothetical protein